MSTQKILSVKFEFIWNKELRALRNFFNASEKFCSDKASKIILDYSLVNDDNLESRIGLVRTTINSLKSLEILYREMVEKRGGKNPIWKHETCICQLSCYLKKINEVSKIFTKYEPPSCRCEIRNESDCTIQDEKGFLIIGPYKSIGLSPFEIDKTEKYELAISNILDNYLETFKKSH